MLSRNNEGVTLLRTYIEAASAIGKGFAVATSGDAKASASGEIKGISAKSHEAGDEVLLFPTNEVRPVIIGATLTSGTKLTSDADGKLVEATAAGDVVVAIAMEGGDDTDEILAWIVNPYELGV